MNNTTLRLEEIDKIESSQSAFPYLEMGGSFVLGLAMGYALKKSFKVLLLLLGLGLIFVFILENQGAVSINEENLQTMIGAGMHNFKAFALFLQHRLEAYGSVGTLSAIIIGFMGEGFYGHRYSIVCFCRVGFLTHQKLYCN